MKKSLLIEFQKRFRKECMMVKKTSLTYSDYIKGIKYLRPDEQLSLIEIISSRMKRSLLEEKIKHSIMELEGLGADIWKGIDAQEYVRKERNSWD